MPQINFINKDGSTTTVEAPIGLSVLEIAHKNNVDLEGACGGALACSTCHVLVVNPHHSQLPKPSEAEEDMLDLAFGVTEESRLGCQIIMTKELDGLVVKIPSATRNIIG